MTKTLVSFPLPSHDTRRTKTKLSLFTLVNDCMLLFAVA